MASWQGFYVMLGSSAAALIGLQFVVVALVANMRQLATASTIHAFGTPTVAHLSGTFIISAIMSAPWPSPVPVAVALTILGLGGVGYVVIVIRRVRQQVGYEPDVEDWLWYAVVPCGLYMRGVVVLPQCGSRGPAKDWTLTARLWSAAVPFDLARFEEFSRWRRGR